MGTKLSYRKSNLECDAVSSPPRAPQSQPPKIPPRTTEEPSRPASNSKHKSRQFSNEFSDEDSKPQSYYDHSINVSDCTDVHIGTRSNINYTFAYPPSFPSASPKAYPPESPTSFEHQGQHSPNERYSKSDSNSESADDSDIESEIGPASYLKLQAAFRMLSKEVSVEDILELKDHIGKGWKIMANKLGYSKAQVDQFKENYLTVDQAIYKLLLDWKCINVKEATVSALAHALYDAKEVDAALRLADIHGEKP